MTVIAEGITGPSILTRDACVRGVLIGDLVVPSGRSLDLHGVIIGNLVVEPGGSAAVHGTVNGGVINRGGDVQVFGTVNDLRDLDPLHPSRVAAEARIGS